MRQTATILRLLPGGMAQIAVTRRGACASDCGHCGGCAADAAGGRALQTTAVNAVAAQPGEPVWVETPAPPVLRAAAAVYLLPVFLFLVAYAASSAAALPEAACAGWGAAGLGLASLAVFWINRRAQKTRALTAVVIARRNKANPDAPRRERADPDAPRREKADPDAPRRTGAGEGG